MKELNIITSKGNFILVDDEPNLKKFIPWDLCTLVGVVKYMTEQHFSEVVDSFELFGNINVGYKNYAEEEPVLDTAKESFSSLVKSLGWYLWRNPVSEKPSKECMGDALTWQQAESKTLYNPILLKKI